MSDDYVNKVIARLRLEMESIVDWNRFQEMLSILFHEEISVWMLKQNF